MGRCCAKRTFTLSLLYVRCSMLAPLRVIANDVERPLLQRARSSSRVLGRMTWDVRTQQAGSQGTPRKRRSVRVFVDYTKDGGALVEHNPNLSPTSWKRSMDVAPTGCSVCGC